MSDFSALLPQGLPFIVAPDNFSFLSLVSPPILDTQPPVITLVSPAPGVLLARNTPFIVDVTDDFGSPFVAIFVRSRQARLYEIAWDGLAFADLYARDSVKAGNRFTLRREGGWPAAPTFTVRAFDGNVV